MSNNTKKTSNEPKIHSISLDSEVIRQLESIRKNILTVLLGDHTMKKALEYILRWSYHNVVLGGREVDLRVAMSRKKDSRLAHNTSMVFNKEFQFHLDEFSQKVMLPKFGKHRPSQSIRHAIWYMYELEVEKNELVESLAS